MFRKLHPVVCVSGRIIFFLKLGFWQIGVFTKYGCFNASKCPQMPHKCVNTIPFGSGHTLGTFNHGLEPLFCCFITHFGVGSSLVAPGAPWCTPGAPLDPLEPPWPLVCHPLPYTIILGHYGSYLTHLEWIIQAFALQYIALHCSAL